MGPSGCGKSTFGQLFVPTNIFDGDLVIQRIQASNPEMNSEDVRIKSSMLYLKLRNEAVEKNLDFALETPFADNIGIDNIYYFKGLNYSIHGIFFGINSLDILLDRIEYRVQEGGHRVTPTNANFNYKYSLLNITSSIQKELFDKIEFYDTEDDLKKVAEYSKNGNILSILDTPHWFNGIRSQLTGWIEEQL